MPITYSKKFNPSQKSPVFNPWDECTVLSAHEEAPGFSPGSFAYVKMKCKEKVRAIFGFTSASLIKSLLDLISRPYGQILLSQNLG